jgi:ABC-type transport system involved in cytochrome c biogenesis permease subunit
MFVSAAWGDDLDVTPLRALPVLDHGRVKPIDTVARETMRTVTGYEFFGPVKQTDEGQAITSPADPVAMVLNWAAYSNAWQTQPVLYVPLLDLRAKLGMAQTQKWISARAVMENTDFTAWVKDIEQKRATAEQNSEKVVYDSPREERLEDAAVELDNRLRLFESACDLSLYPVLPSGDTKTDGWIPVSSILAATGDAAAVAKPLQSAWGGIIDAYKSGDSGNFAVEANAFSDEIKSLAGPDYYDRARIDREVFYNRFKPFRETWMLYLCAVAALITALMISRKGVYIAAMCIFGLAILFHAGAFALRCSITGWAPVTNMYETVIWVAMMGAIFSFILELVYRRRIIAIGGATVAVLATVVAASLPAEFGNSIRNLTPVLRSNYWLSIHVLTIVSSYAAFALALVLGNIVLGQFIYGKANPESIKANLMFTYRSIQIGVLLVAAGTILGGLWADVSWGRFWGWDPKEVWALIVLLTYLALLHGRFAGWIKQFGLAAGAVICFTAVLMSWYGVNFVLGAGLHSYGFETGGQIYVASFVAVQWAYVIIAWMFYKKRTAVGQSVVQSPREQAMPESAKLNVGRA